MPDRPSGAILQRDKKTYAIVPRTPVGLVSQEILEGISEVVRKYQIPIVKITSGQRMALVRIKGKEVEEIWNDLGMDVGQAIELCVHYVQACPGNSVCKFGIQDSLGLGLELEKLFVGMELPAKVKIGVFGCPLCCGESLVRNIGVIGKKSGWTVTFGGNAGGHPRIADVLAKSLSKEEAIHLAKRCLEYYRDNAKERERTARFIERIGIDTMKEALSHS